MERRHVLSAGLAAGAVSLGGASSAAAAQDTDPRIAPALERIGAALDAHFDAEQPGPLDGVALVRQQQRTFLRSNHKYPEFIEVGVDVWENVYFWHIQHRQPLQVGQLADGRYTLAFMFTTLIMRPEVDLTFVGVGFDTDPANR